MKIKDLRSTVRELVLGVKGRKKDDVIQVLWRHASIVSVNERSAVRRRSINIYIITKVCESLYLHSTINFGVRFEAWHLVFQHLHSDVLN